MNKLQESEDLISAKFDKYERDKKPKEEKIKNLEDLKFTSTNLWIRSYVGLLWWKKKLRLVLLIFCFRFLYGGSLWILHQTSVFNRSIENVLAISTNQLKKFYQCFIISISLFFLKNIYQYFDHSNKILLCIIGQFYNFMTLIYHFMIKLHNRL